MGRKRGKIKVKTKAFDRLYEEFQDKGEDKKLYRLTMERENILRPGPSEVH